MLRLIGLNQTEKIGVRYSIFEVPGDIRTTESTHCISLNNKNIYERLSLIVRVNVVLNRTVVVDLLSQFTVLLFYCYHFLKRVQRR